MKLNYKTLGEGKPVIILHGLFGSLDNWQTIAKELSSKYKLYLIDQRNHGDSPHSNEFNYEVMAADLAEFIEDHEIENPSIIGHSMGGKTTMEYAINHTADWDKIVIVDIAPKAYPVHHDVILRGLKSIDIEQVKSRGQADKQLAEYVNDMGTRQFLLKNLSRNAEGGYQWKINLEVIDEQIENVGKGLEEQLAIEKPVLFIRGEKSNYIKNEDIMLITQIFPSAEVETIAGAGHWVHAEKPAELIELILKFLG